MHDKAKQPSFLPLSSLTGPEKEKGSDNKIVVLCILFLWKCFWIYLRKASRINLRNSSDYNHCFIIAHHSTSDGCLSWCNQEMLHFSPVSMLAFTTDTGH
eukprot:28818_5